MTDIDEAAVRALYGALLDTWNRRDADAYAALFVPDGQVIGFDGSQVPAPQVADHLAAIFESHPTAKYVAKIRLVRPLGPNTAMLQAIAGMVPPGQAELSPAVNAVQTLVAQQDQDQWRIVLFQNTPAQHHGRPDLVDAHTAELQQVLEAGV